MRRSKFARTRSMYFSCQAGYDIAAKMEMCLGSLGSKAMDLPFSFFLS